MSRGITFLPFARAGTGDADLTYHESVSRHRGLHVLMQDCSPSGGASRSRFLRTAFREIISRYQSTGRLEHPVAFLRQLIQIIDALPRRVDCRVEDFRGIGVYVVVRDGNTAYLLSGREGRVSVRNGEVWSGLDSPDLPGLKELPVQSTASQKELFSKSMGDLMGLYQLDASEPTGVIEVLLGGTRDDSLAAAEALAEPGGVAAVTGIVTRELTTISNGVLSLQFERADTRPLPLFSDGSHRRHGRARRGSVIAAAAVIAFLALGAVWMTQELSKNDVAGVASTQADAENVARGSQERPAARVEQRSEATQLQAEVETPEPVAAVADEEPETVVKLSLDWSHTYTQPVTTSPVVDDTAVLFGARDGRMYAYDRKSGEKLWSYTAGGGVGASPVAAGNVVIGADYTGRVFCLDRATGSVVWTHRLPAKVVSTPCVAGGEVLVGALDGNAYCLSLETGRRLWTLATKGRIRASIAKSRDLFYVASYDEHLYAVSQGSGRIQWRYRVGGELTSSPSADETRVAIGSSNGVVAVDAVTGKQVWRFKTASAVKSSVLLAGGRVYAGCNDQRIYCVNAESGEEVWRVATGGAVLARPWLDGSRVMATSYDGYIYCIESGTGEVVDRYNTGGAIFSSPAGAAGHVYFGNNEGKFYCLKYLEKRTS